MAVSSKVNKKIYQCDGSTTVFPIIIKLFAKADLRVVRYKIANAEETECVLDRDFTIDDDLVNVTLIIEDPGDSIFTEIPSNAYKLILLREIDLTQEIDYIEHDNFPAETHERGLDRLTLLIQQLDEKIARSILRDISHTTGLVLPPLVQNRFLTSPDGVLLTWAELTNVDYPGSLGYGLDANKSANPSIGDWYLATDTDKVYKCVSNGVWSLIKNLDLSGNVVSDLSDISAAGADIDDAASKKHTQGTDTTLGTQIQNLNMGDKKITNVATATEAKDALPYGQAAGGDLAGTYPNPTIGAGKVITTALKTAQGSVSNQGTSMTDLTLPGGEYGFYPQIKTSNANNWAFAQIAHSVTSTSYVTNIALDNFDASTTTYAQQRYVTASGKDHWIFLLYDKVEKRIVAGYEAPDHPSYGQGGDENEMPHPFANYWNKSLPDNLEIILVDNDKIKELKAKRTKKRGILEIIYEEYEVETKELTYQPKDIADETGKHWKVKSIPSYIKVKKIKKKGG